MGLENTISTLGPVLGLGAAFLLIAAKLPPVLSLLIGAALGGVLGGGGLGTGAVMLHGSIGMLPSAVCILASGILAGALTETRSAERIARTILQKTGSRFGITAIAASVMLLTAAGVFVDIAVLTAAPIALTIGQKTGKSRSAVLLAMIGGGKAGNIISPNPNTIAAARAFGLDLTGLIAVNMIPAFCALTVTVWIASLLPDSEPEQKDTSLQAESALPGFGAAIAGPAAVFCGLVIRPLTGLELDPVFLLPLGGIVCTAATGNLRRLWQICCKGLGAVASVALLLLGTGTLSGVIQASNLQLDMISALEQFHIPAFLLAPISGILMGGAAASTTAGTAIASQTFGGILTESRIPALHAAAMIHAGATVLDSLPHGSFFHATAGCADLTVHERIKLLPLEAAVGLVSTVASVIVWKMT